MTLTPKDQLIAGAIKAGKIQPGSRAHRMLAETYDRDPAHAESLVAQLQASPLAPSPYPAVTTFVSAPANETYPQSWLTIGERRSVERAYLGLEPTSHVFE